MKLLLDFLPIALFFIAYKLGNIYIATGIAIVASLIQVLWSRSRQGRFETMPLITLGILSVLGGATLIFQNELFIKWKPTAVYWILALVFLFSQFLTKKPIIQRMAEQNLNLPPAAWKKLNISWVLFFTLMGCANLYVVKNFDTDTWVNFKLFGTLGLTLVFIILQVIYMARYKQPESGQ
jgi:intracellular septation protein